jgi:hypothetical protein
MGIFFEDLECMQFSQKDRYFINNLASFTTSIVTKMEIGSIGKSK